MGNIGPILLISTGLGILGITGILCLSFTAILRIAIPIGLNIMPKNEELQAVLEMPLSMTLTAIVSKAVARKEEGYIAVGDIDWKATMDPDQLEDVEEALYIEEHNGLGDIQRSVMRPGPLNYGSIASWIVALGSLPAMICGLYLRVTAYRGDGDDDEDGTKSTSVVEKLDD